MPMYKVFSLDYLLKPVKVLGADFLSTPL
jgi:hypothetical protein